MNTTTTTQRKRRSLSDIWNPRYQALAALEKHLFDCRRCGGGAPEMLSLTASSAMCASDGDPEMAEYARDDWGQARDELLAASLCKQATTLFAAARKAMRS